MARKRTETAIEPSNEIKTRRNSNGAKKRMKTTTKKIHESGEDKSGTEEKIPSKHPAESPTSQDQRLIHTEDQAQELPVFSLHSGKEVQPPGKMKLQLFPLNAHTRERLEKDGFHPYLELTLSSRKKISSVLQHIHRKWSSSEIAQGDPTLYPYDKTVFASGHKWIANSNITIGDVYEAVGAPSLFRLRYGWSSGTENETDEHLSPSTPGIACSQNKEPHKNISNKTESVKPMVSLDNPFTMLSSANQVTGPSTSETILSDEKDKSTENKTNNGSGPTFFSWDDGLTSLSIGGLLSEVSLKGNMGSDSKNSNAGNAIATLWQDNLTNISIGGLFSEASLQAICGINHEQEAAHNNIDQPSNSEGSAQGEGRFNDCNKIWETKRAITRQPLPLISDSLDAFLAKQTDIPQAPPPPPPPLPESSHSSILDAEATCHAFSLQKVHQQQVSEEAEEEKQRDESKPAKPLSGSMVSNQDSSLGFSGIKWDVSRGPFDFGLSLS